jgi:hypothetical protein
MATFCDMAYTWDANKKVMVKQRGAQFCLDPTGSRLA